MKNIVRLCAAGSLGGWRIANEFDHQMYKHFKNELCVQKGHFFPVPVSIASRNHSCHKQMPVQGNKNNKNDAFRVHKNNYNFIFKLNPFYD